MAAASVLRSAAQCCAVRRSAAQCGAAPLVHRFDGLQVFNEDRPWAGVYRLDLVLTAVTEGGTATLTVEGATECEFVGKFAAKDAVSDRPLKAGSHKFYLRTTEPHLHLRLSYDKNALTVTQCRLMQGANRPWREVFAAALDGETTDGVRSGGLLHADGGGITLNHPTQDRQLYEMFLDFDPRVLGMKYGISSRRVSDPAKDFTMTAQGRICTSTSCGTSC